MEFRLQAAQIMSRLKPELRTKPIGAAHEVKGMEFSLQAALAMSRLKPELQTKPIGAAHDLTGMEFSLQAALDPGKLKPELRTTSSRSPLCGYGVQPSGCTDYEQAKS